MPPTPLPPDIPEAARPFLREMGYLEPDRLRPGDVPEPLQLERMDGAGVVTLGGSAARPVVLVFGSYT